RRAARPCCSSIDAIHSARVISSPSTAATSSFVALLPLGMSQAMNHSKLASNKIPMTINTGFVFKWRFCFGGVVLVRFEFIEQRFQFFFVVMILFVAEMAFRFRLAICIDHLADFFFSESHDALGE